MKLSLREALAKMYTPEVAENLEKIDLEEYRRGGREGLKSFLEINDTSLSTTEIDLLLDLTAEQVENAHA